jgi:hypothetical protein
MGEVFSAASMDFRSSASNAPLSPKWCQILAPDMPLSDGIILRSKPESSIRLDAQFGSIASRHISNCDTTLLDPYRQNRESQLYYG